MRLCSGPGCGRAVQDDVKFCDECKAERGLPTADAVRSNTPVSYNGTYDATLDGLRKGTRWQRVRAAVVKKFPFCARCETSLTEIVDHIVPAATAIQQAKESKRWPFDRYAGYYLQSNLQGLCRPCHGIKTVEDKQHAGAWPSVLEAYDKAPKKVWSF